MDNDVEGSWRALLREDQQRRIRELHNQLGYVTLPAELQPIVSPFYRLAGELIGQQHSDQMYYDDLIISLQHLVKAKDAAVRSAEGWMWT